MTEKFVEFLDVFGTLITVLLVGVDYWRRKNSKKGNKKFFVHKINSKKVYVPLILIIVAVPLILYFLNSISSSPEEYASYVLQFKFVMRVVWVIAVIYYLIGLFFLPKLLQFPNCKNKES